MKKNKRIGDRESYLEHHAALLPLRFTFVPFGTGHAGSDVIGSPERPMLMEYIDDEATQKRFYEALLKLPWLAPKVRNAIMWELGRSQREERDRAARSRAPARARHYRRPDRGGITSACEPARSPLHADPAATAAVNARLESGAARG